MLKCLATNELDAYDKYLRAFGVYVKGREEKNGFLP